VRFRVQYALQQFLELLFGDSILHLENLLPDVTFFEDFDRKVIKVNLQNPNTGLLKTVDKQTLEPAHFDRLFRLERTDEERNLVAETLLA